MNIAYWLLFLLANVLAYVIGRYDGKRSFGKTVYIQEWPRFSMQWDGHLSQGQIIELMDRVRAHVIANPFAKPQRTKQQSGTDGASGPKEPAGD